MTESPLKVIITLRSMGMVLRRSKMERILTQFVITPPPSSAFFFNTIKSSDLGEWPGCGTGRIDIDRTLKPGGTETFTAYAYLLEVLKSTFDSMNQLTNNH